MNKSSEIKAVSLPLAYPQCQPKLNTSIYVIFLKIKTDSLFTSVPSYTANKTFREINSDAAHLKITVKIFKEYLFLMHVWPGNRISECFRGQKHPKKQKTPAIQGKQELGTVC